jgi:glycosyltransferase involved in cell wall biosynthesis
MIADAKPAPTRSALRPAAFAVPGDIEQKTGGYIYEHQLLLGLRREGRDVEHIVLPGTFPDPSPPEMAASIAAMVALPSDVPLIIDGLVYGSVDTAGLDAIRAPIVAMIHHPLGLETGLSPVRASQLLALEAENLKRADHIVVPSEHTAHILETQFGVTRDRVSIAPPGFARPDPVRHPRKTPPLILSVGLLAARKGHDILLDAHARIEDLPWQAAIVGNTHDANVRDSLFAQRASLGLEARVAITGQVTDSDLLDYYRSASIFALATRYEGYGIVFGEAMSHGLPIVTCDTGAVPDTVGPEAGILVPVDDSDRFADALRTLLTDEQRRRALADASTKAGERLPGWNDTAAVMSGVLDRV